MTVTTTVEGFDRITDALRTQQKVVRLVGPSRATAQCPAHDDHNPSLLITRIEAKS